MLSAKHVSNLKAIECLETDKNSEYDVTKPYDNYDELHKYIESIIKNCVITKYENTKSTIQYRGKTLQLHHYDTREQFKKKDIYGGINKNVAPKNIVCRIMPIICDGANKWIGIYLKIAAQ